MNLEIATIKIKKADQAEFREKFGEAQKLISRQPGYISHEILLCSEDPERFVLLVRWQKIEDHTEGFRGSADYQEWRRLLHPLFQPNPEVLHYDPFS